METLPEETAALRAIIRPLPTQDPVGPTIPAFTFGPRADAYLEDNDVAYEFYLPLLRARLYSVNRRVFAYTLDKELGWAEEDSFELWDLMELPGL